MKTLLFTVALFLLLPLSVTAQNDSARSWTFKGYLDDLQMFQFQKIGDPWVFDNELLNRLDFSWSPGKVFSTGIGMRNVFFFGQSLTDNPDYSGMLFTDNGLVDLTWDIYSSSSFALGTQLDRLWFSISLGKVQFTAGRQRINWGQAVVWNPNDIFNTYSWYNVDYPERPGSDALRLQYYPSSTSVLEIASKWNSEGKITIAGLGRFNAGGYDIQFLAGLVDDQDYMAGAGWSGNIAGAAFRGEVSYYQPKRNFTDTTGILLATVGADYVFPCSFSLTFQALYNQLPPDFKPQNLLAVYQAPSSPKTLSFAEWNLFLMGSYPVTPLFDVSLAGMYYPDLYGFYIGPTLNYNVKQNLDLSLYFQYFNGRFTYSGDSGNEAQYFQSFLGTFMLKWNF